MEELIQKIEDLIEDDMSFWEEWYQGVLADLNITDEIKDIALEALQEVAPINEYDNLFYSQGWVAGMKRAIKLIKEIKE